MDDSDSPWAETGGIARPNTAVTLHGSGSRSYVPTLSETDGEVRPSKATKAAIYEMAIRWPCPKDTDPDRYDARLAMLARDCAELAPGLLRKCGDLIARRPGRPTVIPSASEIHEAAEILIAERAARQFREAQEQAPQGQARDPRTAMLETTLKARNMDLIMQNHRSRWALVGERPELVEVVPVPGARHRCDGQGGVEYIG